jgi:poly(3-hydroxybutyrate) depolymerase
MRQALIIRCCAAALAAPSAAHAAHSVTLPGWVCANPDAIYANGFESGQSALPNDPSNGSGGAYPNSRTRTLHIAGLGTGTQNYYLYLPKKYTPAHAWPLVLILHGVAPWASRDSYATAIRDDWSSVAEAGGFVVAAPVADEQVDVNGTPGATWLVPPTSGPNDYDLFAAVLADVAAAYNIERTRLYGWGFSAGGSVMHDLGVNAYSTAFNASTMAAYSVSAGDLAGLACGGLTSAQCGQLLDALPRRIPVDIHIGTADPNYGYAQNDHALFLAHGWVDAQTIFYNTFDGGHTYSINDLQIAWTNLCPNAVTP